MCEQNVHKVFGKDQMFGIGSEGSATKPALFPVYLRCWQHCADELFLLGCSRLFLQNCFAWTKNV